jgi:collagenase-like PrtC family protease
VSYWFFPELLVFRNGCVPVEVIVCGGLVKDISLRCLMSKIKDICYNNLFERKEMPENNSAKE